MGLEPISVRESHETTQNDELGAGPVRLWHTLAHSGTLWHALAHILRSLARLAHSGTASTL